MSNVQYQARAQRGTPARRRTGPATCGHWLAANADLVRIDAELLAAHVLDTGRAQIIAFPDVELTRRQAGDLDRLAGRLRRREPLAYVLGRKEFYGLDFSVGDSVLVPRPETELLVELVLGLAPRDARVLDLGTGSGCIAVTLKRERPDLRVAATDISCTALAVAAANAAALGTGIQFFQGDWLTCVNSQFDCIVANPPYVAEDDRALAMLSREPRLALIAGADGLAAIDRIVAQAPECMARSGCLVLEHGCDQAAGVRARLAMTGLRDAQTHRDLAGHERATVAFAGA